MSDRIVLGPNDQLADVLEAYAEARLAPRSAVLARVRANVLERVAADVAAARPVEVAPAASVVVLHPWRRRVAAIGLAAAVTVASTAAVLAAPAGSPLYDARLYLEALMLPAPAQADARVLTQERHIEERLADAEAAAARGDVPALEEALDAYEAAVEDASDELGANPDLLAHLQEMLAKHTAVLEALAARLPAQSSIEHAIEASSKAAQKLNDHRAGPPKPHPTPRGNVPVR